MADVRLEGYVQIPDGLLDGILTGDFSALQLRIILVLLRLSYQVRGPVTLSHEALLRALVSPGGPMTLAQEALAETFGSRASGGFRAALNELVARGVIRIIQPPRGRKRATYMPQWNAANWRPRSRPSIVQPMRPTSRDQNGESSDRFGTRNETRDH